MIKKGTMSNKATELIYYNANNLEYFVRFDDFLRFMKVNLLILKVKALGKEDGNKKAYMIVQDSKGNMMKVYDTYRECIVDAGDIIVALGGIFNFDDKFGDTLYLPKGYYIFSGDCELTEFTNMEEVSEEEVTNTCEQLDTKQGKDERLYFRFKNL